MGRKSIPGPLFVIFYFYIFIHQWLGADTAMNSLPAAIPDRCKQFYMTLHDYKDLIKNLPTRGQSFTTKKTTWDKERFKTNKDFKLFLNNNFKSETLQISRQDCFDCNQKFSELLLKIIFWGYPAGMRGKTFQTILNNLKPIKKSLDNFIQENKTLTRSNFENLEKSLRKTGIGLSTLTKNFVFQKHQH